MQMNFIEVYILVALLIGTSTANEIFYVLPDNSPNISCPPHHCATFSQYLLDNDGTLPVTSNVVYHLLSGEHCLNATEAVVFSNFQNFTLVEKLNEQLQLPLVILVSTNITILDSYNITVTNIIFKNLLPNIGDLELLTCISCIIENVTLIGCGLSGYNLIGRSHLNNIAISLTELLDTDYECYDHQGIMLQYGDYSINENKSNIAYRESIMMIQKILINSNNSTCTHYANEGIIKVKFGPYQMQGSVKIIISDSKFYHMDQKIIDIQDNSKTTRCIIWIMRCLFESNFINHTYDTSLATVEVSQLNTALKFFNCEFYHNKNQEYLISLQISIAFNVIMHRDIACTNITFIECNFTSNRGGLLYFNNWDVPYCEPSILFIGPMNIDGTTVTHSDDNDMIYIRNMLVDIHGPVTIFNNTSSNNIMAFELCKIFTNGPMIVSHNLAFTLSIMSLQYCSALFQGPITISDNGAASSIMLFTNCKITFHNDIIFISNRCDKIVTLKSAEYSYMEVIQRTNITFLYNECYGKLIDYEINNDYNHPYPFCLFQFITTTNQTTITPKDFSIAFLYNFSAEESNNCTLDFIHFTSHCKWLNTSVFYGHNAGLINQQIIQTSYSDLKQINHHTYICILSSQFHYDCGIDTLGPVYPGQKLQVDLLTPCSSEEPSLVYAETYTHFLPTTYCKIAHQTELQNIINNHSGIINYTIVSSETSMCELFLTASPHLHFVYEAFYVKLLPCPVGFTLQNGICDCDPFLPPDIDTCYIEQSTIKRPASMWITAHVQSNDTKYLTGNCFMDYCLPYSSNVFLTNPDTQCQFNRTGILCSQCQHPLSMVFGSSRCMKCINLHILIIILIILAGVILVTLIYLLNLTVTNGTVNGIILYVNLVSINDSVFLVNDNVYKPLRLFIYFTNLDLGIETCFYNGMDSYAKMWLQLFFPSYLIIIAFLIIVTSRYSYRILRLTYTRSLPVLATLFLLSYSGVLRVVLTVLFSYSMITRAIYQVVINRQSGLLMLVFHCSG